MNKPCFVSALLALAITAPAMATVCTAPCQDCAIDPVFVQRDSRNPGFPRLSQSEPSESGSTPERSVEANALLVTYEALERASLLAKEPNQKDGVLAEYSNALKSAKGVPDDGLRTAIFESYVDFTKKAIGTNAAAQVLLSEGGEREAKSEDQSAIELYRRARATTSEKDPSYLSATTRLALLHASRGETQEIVAEYRKLKDDGKLGDIPFEARVWLAKQIRNEGNEAIELLKKTQAETPDYERKASCQYLIVNLLDDGHHDSQLRQELELLRVEYPHKFIGFGENVYRRLDSQAPGNESGTTDIVKQDKGAQQ